MGEFHYLFIITIIILLIYLLILFLLFYFNPIKTIQNYFQHFKLNYFNTITNISINNFHNNTQNNSQNNSDNNIIILYLFFLFRLIFCLFFSLYIILLIGYNYNKSIWIYYTNWNVILLAIYYTGVTILSFISLLNLKVKYIEEISCIFIILYLVAAPTAFFVTLVDLALLSSYPSYWNYAPHLVTSIAILIELSLNSVPVIIRDLSFAMTWPVIYLIYIWILRTQHVAKKWPYDFLTTSSSSAFVWYGILFLMVIIFFFIFYGLTKLKNHFIQSLEGRKVSQIQIPKDNLPQLTSSEA